MSYFFYDNIHLCKQALPQKDFDELKEYVTADYEKFPHYNFLKKNEIPINKVEKAIVKMLGDQQHHIEYWFSRGAETLWHVDGDEVYEKNNPGKIGKTAKASYIVFLEVENLIGGEFECTPDIKHDSKGSFRDYRFEPPPNARLLTIFPKENLCVRITNGVYHRVLRTISGKRTCLAFALWSEAPEGYKKHNHWSEVGDGRVVPQHWPIKE